MNNHYQISIPVSELHFKFSRSSGAGGQNVNKVNSKVTLIWEIRKSKSLDDLDQLIARFKRKFPMAILEDETVVITSQRFRSQARNIADCVEKLHSMIQSISTPPKKRKATRPTRSSVEKRIKIKKEKSKVKKFRQRPVFD